MDNISGEKELEEEILGSIAIEKIEKSCDSWKTKLILEGIPTIFKLDTGADVTVIPESLYKKTGKKLHETDAKLTGPG